IRSPRSTDPQYGSSGAAPAMLVAVGPVERSPPQPHVAFMIEAFAEKAAAWAVEAAMQALQLPSTEARGAYLAERRRELVESALQLGAADRDANLLADACVAGAERIMTELLARGTSGPEGRA